MVDIVKIKKEIKRLAKNFGLRYFPKKFQCVFLKKEDLILLDYLSGCPEPCYLKFGETPTQRAKNISKFLKSKEFKKAGRDVGGAVFRIDNLKKHISLLEEEEIKKIYEKILQKLSRKGKKVAAIKRRTKNHLEEIIFHEFIHILLESNGIRLNKFEDNEGLVCYLQLVSFSKTQDISFLVERALKKKSKTGLTPLYLKSSLKFNKIFKNLKDPQQRKRKLKKLS